MIDCGGRGGINHAAEPPLFMPSVGHHIMKTNSARHWISWMLIPVFQLVFLVAIAVAVAGVFDLLHVPLYEAGRATAGFLTAIAWVVLAFVLAPSHPRAAAAATLLYGMPLAWLALGMNFGYFRATVHLSTWLSWLGGVLALMWILRRKKPECPTR